MSARERIQKEAEQWFLTEPVFFTVYCSHRLTMNANMLCPLRTGQGRIEYNPAIIDTLQDNRLHELLKVEMIRILLQHPYSRQPIGCNPAVMQMASDMVIAPAYQFAWIEMAAPSDFGLPEGRHYEWYAFRLNEMMAQKDADKLGKVLSDTNQQQGESGTDGTESNDGDDGGEEQKQEGDQRTEVSGQEGQEGQVLEDSEDTTKETDYTALWEEDAFQNRQITDIIQSATGWGSFPRGLVELIKESATGRIDYRNALRGFRSTILSQKRRLTRMRPSRRFGFEQMGSRYDFTTHLLVAIDSSGSVGSDELGRYLRIINTTFKYGIEEIDVIMFDADIQGDPVTLKNARKAKSLMVTGRGGTNFQAPVDYVSRHPEYDGLIIITDGDAPIPEVSARLTAKLLWVIDNEETYKLKYDALRKIGRVCLMQV